MHVQDAFGVCIYLSDGCKNIDSTKCRNYLQMLVVYKSSQMEKKLDLEPL